MFPLVGVRVVANLTKSLDFACVQIASHSIIYGFSAMPAEEMQGEPAKTSRKARSTGSADEICRGEYKPSRVSIGQFSNSQEKS
ncbi:hypothetical protein LMG26411_02919 [Cupriavidus numazuensis]|uniref:Uncharacterized protein n=1 Tax=Cupriavidus numazuensis TaxID=221992 RepID=A0ABM8TH89_9BURK|nr:hypothetical protein LMG26411_02919 [Cupriavidus numazuensis]